MGAAAAGKGQHHWLHRCVIAHVSAIPTHSDACCCLALMTCGTCPGCHIYGGSASSLPHTTLGIIHEKSSSAICGCTEAGAEPLWTAPTHMAHCAAIRRLRWACSQHGTQDDKDGGSNSRQNCLASCGADNMVRIYQVQ